MTLLRPMEIILIKDPMGVVEKAPMHQRKKDERRRNEV